MCEKSKWVLCFGFSFREKRETKCVQSLELQREKGTERFEKF